MPPSSPLSARCPEISLPFYNDKLYDLGSLDPRWQNILSKGWSAEEIERYMTELYSSPQGVQSQAYDMVPFYKDIFSRVLAGFPSQAADLALELGCGYGSATFALAELLPSIRIVATELSLEMLTRHMQEAKAAGLDITERLFYMQLNADELNFADNSFDIVFGSAILHHLFDPANVIRQVKRILKPGGIAFFAEPFEPGYDLMHVFYEMLLKLHKAERKIFPPRLLTRRQVGYIKGTITYWHNMKSLPRDHDFFHSIDDKWLFPHNFFHKLAKESGFSECQIIPVDNNPQKTISTKIRVHSSGNGIEFSDKVYALAEQFEACFTPEQLYAMPHDGVVVLQK